MAQTVALVIKINNKVRTVEGTVLCQFIINPLKKSMKL